MRTKETNGFRNSYIALSVGDVVVGLFILLWPNMSLDAFYTIVSVVMLVAGITNVLLYFIKDERVSVMENNLVSGVVYASFGAFMLFHSEFVEMAFPFGIGILLLIGALIVLQNAIDMSRLGARRWKIFLIFVVALFALGAILIYTPFGGRALLIFIGLSLIFMGILNIVSTLVLSRCIRRSGMRPGPGGPHRPGHGGPAPAADAGYLPRETPAADDPAFQAPVGKGEK